MNGQHGTVLMAAVSGCAAMCHQCSQAAHLCRQQGLMRRQHHLRFTRVSPGPVHKQLHSRYT